MITQNSNQLLQDPIFDRRYKEVTSQKADGAVFTPKNLADFVAKQIMQVVDSSTEKQTIHILDPAMGEGELLLSMLDQFKGKQKLNVKVFGFETNSRSLEIAEQRLKIKHPDVAFNFFLLSFLEFVTDRHLEKSQNSSTIASIPLNYDIVIANPPYVRTQILGTSKAQNLAKKFGLSGRIDLYFPFILGIWKVLAPQGIAGVIVSNRFMTTKSGATVRKVILQNLFLRHVWDLGDTKLFNAAVLPSVLLFENKDKTLNYSPKFTIIYESSRLAQKKVKDPIQALNQTGLVEVNDGRCFNVQHGQLNTKGDLRGVWYLVNKEVNDWLDAVERRSWGTFRDIGKVRVGVKTCADKVFIRSDWEELPSSTIPELLKPVTTHHIARRFKPKKPKLHKFILYPHEKISGTRQAIDLVKYPRTREYLQAHRSELEKRQYVLKAGRKWYEIWVPQDPNLWSQDKLVFRDIAEKPTFWIDVQGSIVNGDCYWLVSEHTDLLWLAAAVGNSSFILKFYDLRFNNKLYSGRRRFITQYVEKFPLPDPNSKIGKSIISKAKLIFNLTPSLEIRSLQIELNELVWLALTGYPSQNQKSNSEGSQFILS